MVLLRTPVAVAALLCVGAAALAQPSTVPPSPAEADFVVTATRNPQAPDSTPRPVQVITADDIQRAAVGSLGDLLRTLGGVEMTRNGGPGTTAGLFIRGANSSHTVLLIDGLRIGSATAGAPNIDAIPLALIDRIEVLPGPSSSLYGSDAIGGVIQVFTKTGQRSPGANLTLTAGNHGLAQASAHWAGRWGDTDISLGAEGLRTQGENATTADNAWSYHPDRDGYRRRAAQLNIRHPLDAHSSLSLNLLHSQAKTDFDDGSGATFRVFNDDSNDAASLRWQMAYGAVRSSISLGRAVDRSEATSSFPGSYRTTQDQASWINQISFGAGVLSAGVEGLRQAVKSTTGYTDTERWSRAALLGWLGHYGDHSLQADLRYDRPSDHAPVGTGQLAWAWKLGTASRLRAGWGSGFHMPSFNELYYPGFGNPDLKAEHSRNLELGGDTRLGAVDLGATLFDNRIRDLVAYAPPDYSPANVGHARIKGLSLTAGGALARHTRLKFNLTAQDPVNEDSDSQLIRRAKLLGGAQLSQQLGAFKLGTDLAWAGRRYDDDSGSDAAHMGGYALWGLFGGWAINPDWALELRISNATARRYTTALGYTAPGREGQLTLRWTPAL